MLNHRLILNYKARLDQVDTFAVIRELLAAIEETGLRLPADMKISEVHHG